MAYTYYDKNQTSNSITNPVSTTILSNTTTTLIVLSVATTGGTRTGGSPSFSGYNMIQAGTVESSTEGSVELWYALNDHIPKSVGLTVDLPNTGTHSISTIASSYDTASGKWSKFTVVDQANGTSTNPTVTVGAYTAGAVVVAGLFTGLDNVSLLTSGRTLLYKGDTGLEGYGGHYYIEGGFNTSIAMSWTAGSDDWCTVGAAFNEINDPTIRSVNSILYQDIKKINTESWLDPGGLASGVQALNTVTVPIT